MKSWKGCTIWENSMDESMEVGKSTLVTAGIHRAGEKISNVCKQ